MSIIVTLPYDPVWPALDWAKRNCPSYITNKVHPTEDRTLTKQPIRIDYFFHSDKEALLFALTWI